MNSSRDPGGMETIPGHMGECFHFQTKEENGSHELELVSLVEILGECLDKNTKQMAREDLYDKTVVTKKDRRFTKNKPYSPSLLVCLCMNYWEDD